MEHKEVLVFLKGVNNNIIISNQFLYKLMNSIYSTLFHASMVQIIRHFEKSLCDMVSDFSKCLMIFTIEVWTKVVAIKFMSLYKN